MDDNRIRQGRRLAWIVPLMAAAPWFSAAQGSSTAAVAPQPASGSKQGLEATTSSGGQAQSEATPSAGDSKPKPGAAVKSTRKTPARRPTSPRPTPSAAESTSHASSPRPPAQGGAYVYTNEDLRQYIRPEDSSPPASSNVIWDGTSKAAGDKAKTDPALRAVPVDTAQTLANAQARVRSAQDQVDLLRKQTLSDANPLVAPPVPLSDADRARRQGLPRDQVLQQTRDELRKAELELQAAKSSLEATKGPKP